MKLLRNGVLMAVLVITAIVVGQPGTRETAAASNIQSEGQAATQPPGATTAPSPAPALPSSRQIYKGHTIEEIAADPKLLEEVLSLGDYIRPVKANLAEDGLIDPASQDDSSDTVCPSGEECP